MSTEPWKQPRVEISIRLQPKRPICEGSWSLHITSGRSLHITLGKVPTYYPREGPYILPSVEGGGGSRPYISPSVGGGNRPYIPPSVGGGRPYISPSVGGRVPNISPSVGGSRPYILSSVGGGVASLHIPSVGGGVASLTYRPPPEGDMPNTNMSLHILIWPLCSLRMPDRYSHHLSPCVMPPVHSTSIVQTLLDH